MVFSINKQIAALAVSALALAPLATGVTLLSAQAAFAKNGGSNSGGRDNGNRGASRSTNSNSNSRSTQTQTTQTTTTSQASASSNGNAYGQRTADEERPGQGAIRSELKGMNAIHSFKDGAFPNVAPGSQVGRLATYFETAGVTSDTYENYLEAQLAVDEFNDNKEFTENIEGAEIALAQALAAFDSNYSPPDFSLGIDSLDDFYSFIDETYGTPYDDTDNPIDTPEELLSVIASLENQQQDAPDDAPIDNKEQIASLKTIKFELETLERLNAELDLQEEYVALNETLTVEQCEFGDALKREGDAFLEASNGREIDAFSDATIAYMRDTLGLGETSTAPATKAECSEI
jgi:hypothetical protein